MGALGTAPIGPIGPSGPGGSSGHGGPSGSGGSGGGNTRGNQGSSLGQGPQPPPQVFFEMSLHLPDYRGIEDVVEYVHKCEFLWGTKGITTPERKDSQFVTTLEGHAHSWYRKYDPHQIVVDYTP